jgi:hypothetical protein
LQLEAYQAAGFRLALRYDSLLALAGIVEADDPYAWRLCLVPVSIVLLWNTWIYIPSVDFFAFFAGGGTGSASLAFGSTRTSERTAHVSIL